MLAKVSYGHPVPAPVVKESTRFRWQYKAKGVPCFGMDEGRRRVLSIVAGIVVAGHLNTTEDLFDNRSSPRTESMVAAAIQRAERVMRKIDNVFSSRM